jgi:PAS domain S-box-containing protein
LDLIEFENKVYGNEEFFKMVSSRVDPNIKRWEFEARSKNKDYSFVCVTVKDRGYINIYGRDITKQKTYQKELENLSLIVQKTTNGVVITDAKGKVEWINKGFENITGFNLSDFKGKTPGSILQGKETNPETVAYMRAQIMKSEPFICEIYNYKKTGEGYWVRINGQPIFDENGKTIKFFAIEEDITFEKKAQQQIEESEKRFRDVINNSLAIITTHDLEGKFITVNPMVYKMFGYKEHEVIGSSLTDFIPDEDKALFEENYLSKIRKEKEATGIFRIIHKNGDIIYNLYNNYLKEEPGKEPYVIAFGVDVTNRILAEKELKIAKKVTDELAQTKQIFFANMSHEIRTPMNAIMGMSRQLQKTHLSDQQQDYLDTISNASENLMLIINDVLDLAKLEAGKLLFEKIGFELSIVIEKALKVMNHKAEEKGLELSNPFVDPQISPILIGDPYRINQVLLNLVSNAIKFTEVGSVHINCRLVDEINDFQKIEITVSDTGIGMEPSFLKSVFQKFSQEDQSVTRKFGGTGLGMSICKSLVEEMGGEIFAESEKGKGTNIRLCFSFKKGTVNDLTENERTIINTNSLKDKKILVVDDNEMNRMVATLILTDYGSLVTEVVNGLEAIKQLERNSFDLILMDIQMPLLNGYDATKKIRTELKSHIPIIALTANAIKGEHEKCIKAGMDDYLSKPFEEHQFLQIVSHWLENPKDPTIDLNENKKASSLYSLSKLENIARGNQQFIDKMIQLFIDQTPKSVEELKAAYKAGDNSKVKSIAHRIKPSIDTMGIDILKDEIRTIEKGAGSHPSSEQFEKLISKLDTVINEVAESLQKLTK